jgi:hypothetical protein
MTKSLTNARPTKEERSFYKQREKAAKLAKFRESREPKPEPERAGQESAASPVIERRNQ